MKAILCPRYGPPDVLALRDVPQPDPREGEILIRVRAATVTMGDCELRAFKMPGWIWLPARLAFGITRPRQPVLGMEVAGDIAAVGSGVTRFAPGMRVFGSTSFAMGAYAEYVRLKEGAPITQVPDGVSYGEAAGIPTGGLNGLHFIRNSRLKPGETVLINGAAGSIGSFALQLAKRAGAEVTAVDRGDKLDFMRDLGADHVIDYTAQDFWALGTRYDVIIDVVGKSPFSPSVAALNDGGRYYLGNPKAGQVMRALIENRKGRVKVLFSLAGEAIADLDELAALVADGSLRVEIDRTFPLETTPEAHAYVEAGNKKGVVVIDVADSSGATA